MKIVIQLILISVLVITIFFFYNLYFREEKGSKVEIVNKVENTQINKNDQVNETKNQGNEITNLKYNVELVNNGKYEITSSLSKIDIQNSVEIVLMEKVNATFEDKKNRKIFITSDYAKFNSYNYNTNFWENIEVRYKDNIIKADNLDFNFIENNILLFNNVVYTGKSGKIQTDNINIDLITKNIELFMDDNKKKVIINSN